MTNLSQVAAGVQSCRHQWLSANTGRCILQFASAEANMVHQTIRRAVPKKKSVHEYTGDPEGLNQPDPSYLKSKRSFSSWYSYAVCRHNVHYFRYIIPAISQPSTLLQTIKL